MSIYLTKATQKIDGVYDYDREREYKNNGAKKRREDPEYRQKYNEYAREYYRKNHNTPRKKKQSRALTAQEIEERRKYYRDYYRKRHPKKERKKKSIVKKELYASSNRRAEKIIAEMSSGKTVREIAKEQGCTIQNIYEILSTYRKRIKNNPGE